MLSLLLDANLSWRLLKKVSDVFPESLHVDSCSLNVPAKDFEIWEYAKTKGYTIVTNEEDFYELSVFKGFPPNVVLLKTGNQSTSYIAEILIKHKQDIIDLVNSKEIGLLEIY